MVWKQKKQENKNTSKSRNQSKSFYSVEILFIKPKSAIADRCSYLTKQLIKPQFPIKALVLENILCCFQIALHCNFYVRNFSM
ncbi:hypothetical protein L2E82_45755 [Cichorium intybus]|uniref:Uncharacterized protein n=1 Tax=Cichorium intybus TaxID=13427 RepID=A0ACB8ZUU0_CICIN|nr:hypothetical protein L2E82_45755 [Cichorium intybus]